jgi:anti-sigma-K factor RskA
MSPPDPIDDGIAADEALAMDYALGALGRDDRRTVETRLRSDPGFRALVEAWQADLSPLDDATPAVAPPAAVWAAIAAEITPARAVAAAPERPGLWNSLALWRSLAMAGTAAAAIAIGMVGAPTAPASDPGVPPQLLVAALAGADGTPLLSAAYDPLRGAVVLTPATQRDDANGKSPELWVIEGKNPPRSLGVIDIVGPNRHAISSKQLTGLAAGSVLAISIEPLGGSTTGAPTGPVVATGVLTAI